MADQSEASPSVGPGYYLDPRNWSDALSQLMDQRYQSVLNDNQQFRQNPLGHLLGNALFGLNAVGTPSLGRPRLPENLYRQPLPGNEEAMRVIHNALDAQIGAGKTVNTTWGNYLKK